MRWWRRWPAEAWWEPLSGAESGDWWVSEPNWRLGGGNILQGSPEELPLGRPLRQPSLTPGQPYLAPAVLSSVPHPCLPSPQSSSSTGPPDQGSSSVAGGWGLWPEAPALWIQLLSGRGLWLPLTPPGEGVCFLNLLASSHLQSQCQGSGLCGLHVTRYLPRPAHHSPCRALGLLQPRAEGPELTTLLEVP